MSLRKTDYANMARSAAMPGWRRMMSVMQVPVHKKDTRKIPELSASVQRGILLATTHFGFELALGKNMDACDFYIGLFVTNAVVIGGWIFSILQSKANLRRQRRVASLADAYDVLIRTGIDKGIPARTLANGELNDYSRDLERAVATVHLYGSKTEVKLVNELVIKLTNEKLYSADELVNTLREDIRAEMAMPKLVEKPTYLKQTVTDNRPNKAK